MVSASPRPRNDVAWTTPRRFVGDIGFWRLWLVTSPECCRASSKAMKPSFWSRLKASGPACRARHAREVANRPSAGFPPNRSPFSWPETVMVRAPMRSAETEPHVDYRGAWRYRHLSQQILLRWWHRDRRLRPQGWHPNPHPANAWQAQPASTRFPHQQRQCLPQPPQGMAASLPWRRDEEPGQLSRLAPHSGGIGPKDHARGFYLRSYRIRPISTINAIGAIQYFRDRARLHCP